MPRTPPPTSPAPGDDEIVDAVALDWFVRLQDEDPAESLRADFEAWRDADPVHAAAWDEIETLYADLDDVPPPRRPARQRRPGWGPASIRLRAAGAMAASAVLAAGLAWASWPSDLTTAVGERRTVVLADGTTAVLDADSALDVEITPEGRRIHLVRGRAWFDVRHEARPFVVEAGSASVRDIGTGFEVSRHGRAGSVAVSEGEVELSVADGPALRLTEGQAARFSVGQLRRAEDTTRVATWRSGRLEFQGAPLRQVLDDLARMGAGRSVIFSDDLADRRFTGAFDDDDPEAVLEAVLERAGARSRRFGPLRLVADDPST